MIYTVASEHVDIKRYLIEIIERGVHEKFFFQDKFPNFKRVNVMGEHPFARLEFAVKEGVERPKLFPAISVSVLSNYGDAPTLGMEINQAPVDRGMVEKWKANPYQLTDKAILDDIDLSLRKNLNLFAFTTRLRYSSVVTIETWADNLDVKDFLYHITRATLISALEEMANLGLENVTIEGKQDGLYNDDMGMLLYGSQIFLNGTNTFEVSDIVENVLLNKEYSERVNKNSYYPGIDNVDFNSEYDTLGNG